MTPANVEEFKFVNSPKKLAWTQIHGFHNTSVPPHLLTLDCEEGMCWTFVELLPSSEFGPRHKKLLVRLLLAHDDVCRPCEVVRSWGNFEHRSPPYPDPGSLVIRLRRPNAWLFMLYRCATSAVLR